MLLNIIFLNYNKVKLNTVKHFVVNTSHNYNSKKVSNIHSRLMILLAIFYIKYTVLKENKKSKKDYFSPTFNLKIFLISLWGSNMMLKDGEKYENINYGRLLQYLYKYYLYTMSYIISYYY